MTFASSIVNLNRRTRRITVWAAQILSIVLAGSMAFLLRFDLTPPRSVIPQWGIALLIWLIVKMSVFHLARLDRGWWRYVSMADVFSILLGNVAGSAISILPILLLAPPGFPRSIYPLDMMICFLGMVGVRAWARWAAQGQAENGGAGKRTLIYGAGDAGVMLLRELQMNSRLPYKAVGFLDDHPDKQGLRILGIPVMGTGQHTASLVAKERVDTILIAIPSATGMQMTNILRHCHAARVECKTIPGFDEIMQPRALASTIRDVKVQDLLGRHPVHIQEERIRHTVENQIVLVTGAAGSIGSELCRQIARFSPAAIVGLDIGESPLFEIEREMRESYPAVRFYPEVGSIQNRARLTEIIGGYRPSLIYHAAAYKHVPMMESCVFEAIENNVFGTYKVASVAAECGVEGFILISSDKAVRPTNIMGATKRVAELMLSCFPESRTRFIAVRFGNVLGSNGSVIPTFKRQISAGGPVTVTHPDMRRYFMTIPEASLLVMQSSVMAQSGQICVLDMGEPVKIVDLARNLILLSGLRPDIDIQLKFTGIRPGEKLYEELSTVLEDTLPTTHSKIHIYQGPELGSEMSYQVAALEDICARRDLGALLVLLKELVPDYSPSADLLKRLVESRSPLASKARA